MIQLRDLSAGYGGRDVVRGVTLDFPPGRVLALLGPNGCGKSTLLRAALGLLPRSGGQVLLDGAPLESLSPPPAGAHGGLPAPVPPHPQQHRL